MPTEKVMLVEDVYAVEWGLITKTLTVEHRNKDLMPSPTGENRVLTPFSVTSLMLGCGVQEHLPVQMEITPRETMRMLLPMDTKVRVNIAQEKAVIILP